MCVVDLSFILINDTVGLIRQVRLVVTCLSHNDNVDFHRAITTTFRHLRCCTVLTRTLIALAHGVLSDALPNDDTSAVTRIGEVN